MSNRYVLILSILAGVFFCRFEASAQDLHIRDVVTGLDTPWEILWGPDNRIWFTERGGRVSRVDPETGETELLLTIPDVQQRTESGLLGMVLHPDFPDSPYVFLVYTYQAGSQAVDIKEKLVRYTYNGAELVNPLTLISGITANVTHDGSRLVILPDRTLVMTVGDAQIQMAPPSTTSLNGKTLRINLDGSIPADNPWASSPSPTNMLWTIGHRNPQGLVWANGMLYSSEHGAERDDELNIIQKGRNYGWPNVQGYCDNVSEMQACEAQNVVEPIHAWTPTLATAGLDYYDNAAIPEWRGCLLLATLKEQDLRVLKLSEDGTNYVSETIYYNALFGRLRDICVSPDGRVFVCTSNRDGRGVPGTYDDRIIEIRTNTVPTATLAAPTTDTTAYTAGASMSVDIAASGPFDPANTFTVQLSDRSGSFDAPTVFGRLSGSGGGAVTEALSCEMLAGNYRVRVISTNPALTSEASEKFSVRTKPNVKITPQGATTFCQGDSVRLRATAGFSGYLWSTGGVDSQVVVRMSGTYSVITADALGCLDTAFIAVAVKPVPEKPTITQNEDLLMSSPGEQYQWYRGGLLIPGATGQNYLVTESGSYTVAITNGAGCATLSDPVDVEVTVAGVDKEAGSGEGLVLYPHPVGDRMTVRLDVPRAGRLSMTITDASGAQVFSVEQDVPSGEFSRELALEGLPTGVYWIELRSGGERWQKKFVRN